MLTRVWRAFGQPVAYRGRRLWFVLVLAALLWGMLRPEGPHEPFPHFAVGLHALAFLALGLSARFAFERGPGIWIWLPLFVAAPGFEILQALVQPESREFSALDIGGNALGAILAMSLWPWVREGLGGAEGRPSSAEA